MLKPIQLCIYGLSDLNCSFESFIIWTVIWLNQKIENTCICLLFILIRVTSESQQWITFRRMVNKCFIMIWKSLLRMIFPPQIFLLLIVFSFNIRYVYFSKVFFLGSFMSQVFILYNDHACRIRKLCAIMGHLQTF